VKIGLPFQKCSNSSHTEELEVNERILTTILCKPSVSVPYNLHHDAANRTELVI
jgi:hypothetical protein